MKRNAIIRIIIFSIVICILVGILTIGILANLFGFRSDCSNEITHTPIADGTFSSSGSVNAEEIRNIHIEWVAGNITLIPGDTDQIIFEEFGVKDDDETMAWKQTGNELEIQYCQDTIDLRNTISFGINIDYSKDLVITVPKSWICNELEVEAASASMEITGLSVNEIELNSASGTILIDQCEVNELSIETVSGDIDFTGTINSFSCSAVSANCTVNAMNVPKEISMEGVSGDLDLTLPSECGFTASIETVSGSFSSDFATSSKNGNHIYGDGACRIEMEGVSGDISIHQMKVEK